MMHREQAYVSVSTARVYSITFSFYFQLNLFHLLFLPCIFWLFSFFQKHNISFVSVVVCNLYPFKKTVQSKDCSVEEAVENIDIGSFISFFFWVYSSGKLTLFYVAIFLFPLVPFDFNLCTWLILLLSWLLTLNQTSTFFHRNSLNWNQKIILAELHNQNIRPRLKSWIFSNLKCSSCF